MIITLSPLVEQEISQRAAQTGKTFDAVVDALLSSALRLTGDSRSDPSAHGAEIDAAYADYPNDEERRAEEAMRRRFVRTLEPEEW